MTYSPSSLSSNPAEWAFKEAPLNQTLGRYLLPDLVGVLSEVENMKLLSIAKNHSGYSLVCSNGEKGWSPFRVLSLFKVLHLKVIAILYISH